MLVSCMCVFTSADNRIFIYDTSGQKFEEYRTVLGRDVGWSILDMVFR